MAFLVKCSRRCVSTSFHFSPSNFQKPRLAAGSPASQGCHCCFITTSCCGNKDKTTNLDFSTDPDERYNVHTYQLPLSDEQHEVVLKTLNEATLKELIDFNLSKTAAQKLISARQMKRSFKHIRELLLVEGLGFKKIESVCNNIVHSDADHARKEKHAHKWTRKLFVPERSHHNHQGVHSVVGLGLKGPVLCWCWLQRSAVDPSVVKTLSPAGFGLGTVSASSQSADHSWRVASLKCRELAPFKLELPTLYDQLCRAMKEIPVSDVYIFTDKIPVKQRMGADELSTSLAHEHLKGLLAIALNCRAGQEVPFQSSGNSASETDDVRRDPGVVYYAKESLASKALVLKGPSQRLTGALAARSLLSGQALVPLPGLTVPPDAVHVYNNVPIGPQYGLTTALLSALSFTLLS